MKIKLYQESPYKYKQNIINLYDTIIFFSSAFDVE